MPTFSCTVFIELTARGAACSRAAPISAALRGVSILRNVLLSDASLRASWLRTATLSVGFALLGLMPLAPPAHAQDINTGWALFEAGDHTRALRALTPHAESGDRFAQFAVGEILLANRGVPRAPEAGIGWHRRAAEQGVPLAQERIGAAFYHGFVYGRDFAQAAQWFARAADAGLPQAQSNLAVMLLEGQGVAPDPARALGLLEAAATREDANALNTLANLHRAGNMKPRDPARARELYERAAAQKHAIAMDNLGTLYYAGDGVPRDFFRARAWYARGAALGEARALTHLGEMQLRGLGGARDEQAAASSFRLAAQRSYADAEFNLGAMFVHGDGVVADREIGLRWLALAAANGSERAKGYLLVMADEKLAPEITAEKRRGFFNELAAVGKVETQMLIGELYEKGELAQAQPDEAKRWYGLAARRGYGPAQKKLER